MTIEKLTDENRAALLRTDEGSQALRIIDELTVFAGTQTDECARLRAENERLRAEVAIAWDDQDETNRANRFEALFQEQRLERRHAESRLVNATALLGRWVKFCYGNHINAPVYSPWQDTEVFLANQPGAPLAGTPECTVQVVCAAADRVGRPAAPYAPCKYRGNKPECPYCHQPAAPRVLCAPGDICQRPARCLGGPCLGRAQPAAPTRTEAEQAVLDAAVAWFDGWTAQHGPCYMLAPHPAQDAALWAAELARRGLK